MYYPRLIDSYLLEWASRTSHKPLLLRGARQVGKSSAVQHLGESFEQYVELNFEKSQAFVSLFTQGDLDVRRIVPQIESLVGKHIVPGKTLLFLDEVQACPQAIMALRFFKEDLPELHVIAAGSLLEFALDELPTFGVGRIHSMYMYPMTFDEFLVACGEQLLLKARREASAVNPLPQPLHEKLVSLLRNFILVGGMPEVVSQWVKTHDYLVCQEVQDDIVFAYEDDFPKYRKKVDPALLRLTLRSAAVQATKKFVYAEVGSGYKVSEVKKALELLSKAGILIPVTSTAANGLPLGSEANPAYRKMLILDSGLMLRLLHMSTGDATKFAEHILTSKAAELVNRGPMAEMVAGLELLHYNTPNLKQELYYWLRLTKNAQAEIDYVVPYQQFVLPIEVKASTQGGMKSLWAFMRDKHLSRAIRCSLENFGSYVYTDALDAEAERQVIVCPLYALSQMESMLKASTMED